MPNDSKKETEYWDLYRADGRLEKVIPSKGYDIPADVLTPEECAKAIFAVKNQA